MSKFLIILFLCLIRLWISIGSNTSDAKIRTETDAMCTTIYYPHWGEFERDLYYIDKYLWNNTHKLLFRVITPNEQIIYPLITIQSNDTQYLLKYLYTNNTRNTLELTAYVKRKVLREISSKTIHNVAYDSFMWTSWDLYNVSDPYTYFRGGVGSTFDNFSSGYHQGYTLKPNEIETAYFYDYHEVGDTKWEFYHNLCSFQIDLYIVSHKNTENRLFSIYDYIHLNSTLLQANALNIPIYITSNDILNVNHSLFINEFEQCMLCDRRLPNVLCTNCTQGIRIADVRTYDIDSNKYAVNIYTENDDKNISLNGQTVFEFVRKIQNVSIETDASVNIGGFIPMHIEIIEDDVYQTHSVIHAYHKALAVNHNIYVSYNMNYNQIENCTIYNRNTGFTQSCDEGIGPIQVNNQSDTDQNQFTLYKGPLYLSSNDTYLVRNELPVVVEIAYVDFNEWVVSDDRSSICPNDQCCQDINGCNYYPQSRDGGFGSNGYLCAYNRNHTVALCGSCIAGYAEVFNAPYCRQCDTDHYDYLLLPIAIAFVVVFILVLFDTTMYKPHNISPSQQRHIALMTDDEAEGVLIVIFRIFIVFYQCINYILWQAGYTFWGSTMIQILSLDSYLWLWISGGSGADGVCFLQNLTAMQYHIWYLYFPICLMLVLFIFVLMKRTCCKSILGGKPCEFGGYTIWNLVLIVLFPVLVTFVIMFSCRHINDEYGTVHFYAADTKCYGAAFFVAAFLSIMIMICFICIWFYIKKMNPSEYNSVFWKDGASCLRGIARPYKTEYWYFEFIMIIRKVVVITCITLQYVHRSAMHIIVLIIFFSFACLELIYRPFKYKRAMYMDLVCIGAVLVSLVIMIVNINNNFFYEQSTKDNSYTVSNGIGDVNHMSLSQMNANQIATVVCMSITIMVPNVLLLWYIAHAVWSCCSMRSNVQESNAAMKRRIKRMKQRLEWIGHEDKISSPLYVQKISETDAEEVEQAALNRKNTTTLTMILNAENEESAYSFLTKKSKTSMDDHGYEATTTAIETMDDYSDEEIGSVTESNTFSTHKRPRTEMVSLVPSAARNNQKKSKAALLHREHTLKKVDEDIEIICKVDEDFKRHTNPAHFARIHNEESISSVSEDTFSERPPRKARQEKKQPEDSDVTRSDHEDESDSDSEGDAVSGDDLTHIDVMSHGEESENTQRHQEGDDDDDDESQIALNPIATKRTPQVEEHQTPCGTETPQADTDSDPDGDLTLLLEEMVVQIVKDTPGNTTVDSKSSEPLLAPTHAATTDSEQEEKVHDADECNEGDNDSMPMPMPLLLENNKSITLSVPSESVQLFHPSRSHQNDNQFDIDHQRGYQYEYTHHSQDVVKKKAPVFIEETKQNPDDNGNRKKRAVPKPPKRSFKRVTKLNASNQLKLNPVMIRNQKTKHELGGNPTSPLFGNQSFLRQHTATYSVGSRSRPSNFQRTKPKKIKREGIKEESKTESVADTSSEYESISYTSTAMDVEKEKKSWIIYRDNLKKIFVCFAGCHPQFEETKEAESVVMSLKQIKKFLDIVSITKYWTVQQVLEVMHPENENNLGSLEVTMDDFVQYFCNEALNPKVKDIKKHIEKQISWKWLLKSQHMFEQIDVNKKGYLDIHQFAEYAKSYNWNTNKSNTLFRKIDCDQSGSITIMQLFDWFCSGFKAAQQRNKGKHLQQTSATVWSGTHSSFYNSSLDTKSVTTYQTEDSQEEW